jgi:hypothetical protein
LGARRAVGCAVAVAVAVAAVGIFPVFCVKIFHCPKIEKAPLLPQRAGALFQFLIEFRAKKDATEEDWKNLCGVVYNWQILLFPVSLVCDCRQNPKNQGE